VRWARRQYRGDGRPRQRFLRRLKYETLKEGGGALLGHAGIGLGAAIGLQAARWGVPQTHSVIAGAIIGSIVGAIGKGLMTTTADHLQERGEGGEGEGTPASDRGQLVAPGVEGPLSGIIGLTADLNAVVRRTKEAYAQLGRLLNDMRTSHDALMLTLYGGRSDALTQISKRMVAARRGVEEAQELLRHSGGNLSAYMTSL
jgi:hypothetical protein